MTYLTKPVFRHIYSIGYEFEAHNLTKIVLSKDTQNYIASALSAKDTKYIDMNRTKGSTVFFKQDRDELVCKQPDRKDYSFCFYADSNTKSNSVLEKVCAKTPRWDDPNNYWSLRVADEMKFIHFEPRGKDEEECSYFPDVEWNITFYKIPSQSTVVLDTFKRAVDLILDQLDQGVQPVQLIANGSEKRQIINTRLWANSFLEINKHPFTVVPQLTFTCPIQHCMDIIQGFLFPAKKYSKEIMEMILFVRTAPVDAVQQNYLFLVMYMEKRFRSYKMNTLKSHIFKYYMVFMPRHPIRKLVKKLYLPPLIDFLKAKKEKHLIKLLTTEESMENIDSAHSLSHMFKIGSVDGNDLIYIEFRKFPQLVRHYLNHTTFGVDLLALHDALHPGLNRTFRHIKTKQRSPSPPPRTTDHYTEADADRLFYNVTENKRFRLQIENCGYLEATYARKYTNYRNPFFEFTDVELFPKDDPCLEENTIYYEDDKIRDCILSFDEDVIELNHAKKVVDIQLISEGGRRTKRRKQRPRRTSRRH